VVATQAAGMVGEAVWWWGVERDTLPSLFVANSVLNLDEEIIYV
jgi:hypothetical protein